MLTISITKNEITPASLALKKIGGEEKSTPPNERLRVGPDNRLPERSGPIAESRDPNLKSTQPRPRPNVNPAKPHFFFGGGGGGGGLVA
jgi:hypothetical protein